MLCDVGLFSEAERDGVLAALDTVEGEIESGSFEFQVNDEDIHTAVERRVTELEPAGAKMHTGRSRNEQVATDVRLWTRGAIDEVVELIERLHAALAHAEQAGDLPARLPPPAGAARRLSHHLLTHGWALARDGAARRCPQADDVGARRGALAGSSLPLDPEKSADYLGFDAVFDNSLTVSPIETLAEALFAVSLLGVHLSRIGEEWILWASTEFEFVTLDDGFSTKSSMMPRRRTPILPNSPRASRSTHRPPHGFPHDAQGTAAHLQQGHAGGQGAAVRRRRPVRLTLLALDGMISTTTFNTEAMAAQAASPAAATDLAEWLVAQGMPFLDAHAVVGEKVRRALAGEGSLGELVAVDPRLGDEAAALLEPGVSATRRTTRDGAPSGGRRSDRAVPGSSGRLSRLLRAAQHLGEPRSFPSCAAWSRRLGCAQSYRFV